MEAVSHLSPGPAEVPDEPCAEAELKKKEPPLCPLTRPGEWPHPPFTIFFRVLTRASPG